MFTLRCVVFVFSSLKCLIHIRLLNFLSSGDLNSGFLSFGSKTEYESRKDGHTQLIEFASDDIFKYCVKRYNGNYKAKDFTCWKQFLCMAFGQLTHRESLSDTVLCLKLHQDKLYQLGIGKAFSKSTISRANTSRDWRIFRDFGLKLIEKAKGLYADDN